MPETEQIEQQEIARSEATHRYKRRCIVGLVLLAALLGTVDYSVNDSFRVETAIQLAGALIGLCLIFTWLYYDSVEQHYRMGPLLRICIILVAGLGIPIYLFKTRGLRGFISIGLAALFVYGLYIVHWAATWLV